MLNKLEFQSTVLKGRIDVKSIDDVINHMEKNKSLDTVGSYVLYRITNFYKLLLEFEKNLFLHLDHSLGINSLESFDRIWSNVLNSSIYSEIYTQKIKESTDLFESTKEIFDGYLKFKIYYLEKYFSNEYSGSALEFMKMCAQLENRSEIYKFWDQNRRMGLGNLL